MKSLIGTVFLVLVAFLNSIGGHQPELSSIRTFQYRPAVHTYMKHLTRKVDGHITEFNAYTTLVARGATLFGWLNNNNVIEPIFMRNQLTTYNLDEQEPSVASMPELIAYGVNGKIPVGPCNLDPIRIFHYRPALHAYLAPLRKKIDNHEVRFDAHTILVARGANLFGWLNIENVIEPIFLRKNPVMYNLDEHMESRTNIATLISFGLFDTLPVIPLAGPQPAQSRSRSRSRSPRNWRRDNEQPSAQSASSSFRNGVN